MAPTVRPSTPASDQCRSLYLDIVIREMSYMRHCVKSLDIFFHLYSVCECANGIFVLVHGRKQTIWDRDRGSIVGVYHRGMGRHGGCEWGVGSRGECYNLGSHAVLA